MFTKRPSLRFSSCLLDYYGSQGPFAWTVIFPLANILAEKLLLASRLLESVRMNALSFVTAKLPKGRR